MMHLDTESRSPQEDSMDQGRNLKTHTGKVHAPHPTMKVRNLPAPQCMSKSQVRNLHYAIPTDQPVNCGKCLNYLAKQEDGLYEVQS